MAENLFFDTLKTVLDGNGHAKKSQTKTAGDVEDKIVNFYENGHLLGTPTYLPQLNEHLRWRDGFLYTLTGYPSVGKSTFINYLLLLRAQNEGTKIAIYSPETYPIEDMVEELMIQHVGKNVASNFGNQMSVDERNESVKFLKKHFFLVEFDDIPTQEDVFNEFARLVIEEDIKICVIDPFNSLVEGANMGGGGNISVFLKGALTRAKLFAVKNEVSMVIIEHPKSISGQISDERPPPSPFMIYGGSMFWNKSDVFFTVDRDIEDNNNPNVFIRVWKVKKQRLMGVTGEVTLNYDWKTSRYS